MKMSEMSNRILDTEKQKISEPQDITIETIQNETQKENDQSISEL